MAIVAEGGARPVELVLDRGRVDDGAWVGEPVGADRVVDPPTTAGEGSGRSWATLGDGAGVAVIDRGCGRVSVPYFVERGSRTVSLPYPACAPRDTLPVPGLGTRLDRREVPWSAFGDAHGLGLWREVPGPPAGEDDGPARYVTFAEAAAWCAWNGARLPTAAEWEAAAGEGTAPVGEGPVGLLDLGRHAPVGPGGHEDLLGNVEEWLEDGRVAGGSWLRAGRLREVPVNARAETIGFRCAE